MLAVNFQHKIKQLNSHLKFYGSSDKTKPLALYLVEDGEAEHICGVDRNELPEFTEFDKKGHIVKAGWRRTLKILIQKGLVSRRKAEALFGISMDSRKKPSEAVIEDRIGKAINDFSWMSKDGLTMKKDDIMDISKEIRKEKVLC